MRRSESPVRKSLWSDAQSPNTRVEDNPSRYLAANKALSAIFRNARYGDLLIDLINSEAFQRLRDIRFLGAIDYVLPPLRSVPNRGYTRYEHSLNVARLAQAYSHASDLAERSEKHLVVAALLHDIGHGPLSHSLEPAFKERFQLTHHEATLLIVRGTVPLGHGLTDVFRRYGIDRNEIVALIEGRADGLHSEALRGPINIDTIEAILRSYSYISPGTRHLTPVRILNAFIHRTDNDRKVLDKFWGLKDFVYRYLINGRLGVTADYLCQEYVRRNAVKFWSGNYFVTETRFRREHAELFALLDVLRRNQGAILSGGTTRVIYQRRTFFVDENAELTDMRSVYRRYKQAKSETEIKVGDLFNLNTDKKKRNRSEVVLGLFERDGGRYASSNRKRRTIQ